MKRKSIKIFFHNFLLVTLVVLSTSCGSGTTIVGNTSTTTQSEITIGKLSNGSSAITIPLAAFGDTDEDVETTTLAITKNGTALTGDFDLPSHYDSTTQIVSLTLTELSADDLLAFLFTRSSSFVASYYGRTSTTAATTATSSASSSSDGITITVSDDGRYISGEFSSSFVGAYVPTTGSCFRSDITDYEPFLVASDGGVVLIDFLEDNLEGTTVFSEGTATSFSAAIPSMMLDAVCEFTLGTNEITGSCPPIEGCEISYEKCSSLSQSDYYNSTSNTFTTSSATNDALDSCYNSVGDGI